ncbi:lipid II:glycine glycyltransferase FemX [Natrinema salifodinae]|uniref:Acetyltransferase (GNAT) domain-containing protein n=1 Tax=Natrinema salifodinae TaxID=1202768 RepID=A0A1I0PHR2_9EURY|nr:GNAT family N-acetyltransferase [Natrinema salifodinae]SEW13257.1 Acetyltransferase (GNAT) domain-containing protein [Natrinema salifodinae]
MAQKTGGSTRSKLHRIGSLFSERYARPTVSERSNLEVDVVDTVRDVGKEQWNGIVDRSSRGSVFHRYEWLDAIETGLNYTPRHLVVTKDGNRIGLMPNFVVEIEKTPFNRLSSLYPGFGGPLLPTDPKESLECIVETVPKLCRGTTIVHQIRGLDTSYLRYNDALQSWGYRPFRRECRFLLDLTKGHEQLLEDMSRTRRRGIERGRDADYEIVEEELTRENLQRFYRTYERVMDRVDGDVYPFSFFEQLQAMESRFLLLTIRIDGEYAGGMLEVLDDEHDAVHGFFAAVPREYFDDHASELLYDHVFQWGIEHGYETYDFGSTNTDFEDGVYRFKEGFGGRAVPVLVWERGCSPLWKLVKAGRSLYWPYYT